MASHSAEERRRILDSLNDAEVRYLAFDWRFWARPSQLAPAGDWFYWLIMSGRGFGKTRAGGQWTHERAQQGNKDRWIALIANDPGEARNVMMEGPSGILRNAPPWERPAYRPSIKRLVWPNGAYATIFSAQDPEELRGFGGDTAWLDEPGKYRLLDKVFENLLYGLREAKVSEPRLCLTTTPKPRKVLKELLKNPACVVTGGSSYDNRANLSEKWFREVIEKKEGTTLAQQEIYGRMLDQMPGAKWQRDWIDANRVRVAPALRRIVVAVDPPGGATECGIVVAGVADRHDLEHLYILDDLSQHGSPGEWAKTVVKAYREWRADAVVAETNFGGDMVAHTLHTEDPNVPVRVVRASRGKAVRAEPVSALYEQGRAHHVRDLAALEDELCTWEPDAGMASPNRLDALVWAATDLVVESEPAAVEAEVEGFSL